MNGNPKIKSYYILKDIIDHYIVDHSKELSSLENKILYTGWRLVLADYEKYEPGLQSDFEYLKNTTGAKDETQILFLCEVIIVCGSLRNPNMNYSLDSYSGLKRFLEKEITP